MISCTKKNKTICFCSKKVKPHAVNVSYSMRLKPRYAILHTLHFVPFLTWRFRDINFFFFVKLIANILAPQHNHPVIARVIVRAYRLQILVILQRICFMDSMKWSLTDPLPLCKVHTSYKELILLQLLLPLYRRVVLVFRPEFELLATPSAWRARPHRGHFSSLLWLSWAGASGLW